MKLYLKKVAIHIASSLVFHKRTKHIKIEYHFIIENLLDGLIIIEFVNFIDQLADGFTKSLRGTRVEYVELTSCL